MARIVTLTFDDPPSINKMFGQAKGRKRYPLKETKAWTDATLWKLKAAHVEPFTVPFEIEIAYPDVGRYDVNNRDKGPVDCLKKAGIIPNDSRKWLRKLTLLWADVTRTTVTITEARPFTVTYGGSFSKTEV